MRAFCQGFGHISRALWQSMCLYLYCGNLAFKNSHFEPNLLGFSVFGNQIRFEKMNIANSLFMAFIYTLNVALDLYVWVLIIGAVLSWLIFFDVINPRNRIVAVVSDFCTRVTEPVLRRIRRFLPTMNGLDLSPVILILIIIFIQVFLSKL